MVAQHTRVGFASQRERERASREASVTLRGKCWWLGEYVFQTWIAQSYLPALCSDITAHAAESGEEIMTAIAEGVDPLPETLYPSRLDLNDLPASPPAHIQLPQPILDLKRLHSARSLPPQKWATAVASCMGVSEHEWNDLFRVRAESQPVQEELSEPSEFVKDGGGAAVGLDARRHVEWARTSHVHLADYEPQLCPKISVVILRLNVVTRQLTLTNTELACWQ